MAVSRAHKRGKPTQAQKDARALRNAEQEERAKHNRAHPELRTPWGARREERRIRRAQDPNVQMQPRTQSGMIINRDGTLKYDTDRARNDALVRAALEREEEAARALEKRTASAKAKKARAAKRAPGKVTTRNTNTK